MPRYTDIDKLIAEYDRVHIGPAGGARKLMVEAPIADVAPRAEVDLYKKLNEELEDELASTYDKLENSRAEVAREIFEEIEQTCRVCGAFGVRGYIMDDVANLKKKYTEGQK